jgi:hypothetical protein
MSAASTSCSGTVLTLPLIDRPPLTLMVALDDAVTELLEVGNANEDPLPPLSTSGPPSDNDATDDVDPPLPVAPDKAMVNTELDVTLSEPAATEQPEPSTSTDCAFDTESVVTLNEAPGGSDTPAPVLEKPDPLPPPLGGGKISEATLREPVGSWTREPEVRVRLLLALPLACAASVAPLMALSSVAPAAAKALLSDAEPEPVRPSEVNS